MKLGRTYLPIREIFKKISVVFITVFAVTSLAEAYILGVAQGYILGQNETETKLAFLRQITPTETPKPTVSLAPTPRFTSKVTPVKSASWGGPELWEAVNKRRSEFGVNPLSSRSELCTVASIRLNELLELGKLDNHEGFTNMTTRRPDLKWIFDKYSIIAEFLAMGGMTAQETVSMWENTLGHRKLLDGGEYVWGCIYAQNTFAVAITAY